MLRRCASIVRVLRTSCAAISRFVRPAATSWAISCSRAVSGPASADDRLTLAFARQAAGQRVIYSYPGLTPPESLLARIRAGEAAGVIFFGENVSSLTQIRGVVQQLRAASAQSPNPNPLLLMTDQEGGLIRRLPGEPALSHKDIGLSSNPVTETSCGSGRRHPSGRRRPG